MVLYTCVTCQEKQKYLQMADSAERQQERASELSQNPTAAAASRLKKVSFGSSINLSSLLHTGPTPYCKRQQEVWKPSISVPCVHQSHGSTALGKQHCSPHRAENVAPC